MKNIYKKHLEEIALIDNDGSKLNALTSTLRSVLQVIAISAIEVSIAQTSIEQIDIISFIERLKKPSDGLPIEILEKLLPHLRSQLDIRLATGWFESQRGSSKPLSKDVDEWVQYRNKHPGHGVVDSYNEKIWVEKTHAIILNCLDIFEDFLPSCSIDCKNLTVLNGTHKTEITVPLARDGLALVLTGVRQKLGIWKLTAQSLTYDKKSMTYTIDLSDDTLFSKELDERKERYQIHEIVYDNATNIVEHNLPVRLTSNFEGREQELEMISEWLEDEDSRRCLIYGDGGYGKTTLLIEILNRLLEGELPYSWFNPSLISFYTAKMTLWTADGINHISTRPPLMDECLRELMLCFYPVLDKKWFEVSGKALIDKVAGELSNRKYGRNDVLLIIDNSETLASSYKDTAELASFLKLIGKKIGRVIITSRRQENIEATPILISALDEGDCVKLLRNLAESSGAEAINKAGTAKLKKVANKLMYKPILIESLVVYISRSGLSIDAAIDNLYQKTDDDLLEFLYEDAWERLEEDQREAFYVIVSLTKPLSDISIGKTCQIVKLQHSEFQSSLQETHFATFTDYGNKYSIELVDLARRFFEKKLNEENELNRNRIKEQAFEVDEYVKERERIDLEYIEDRVSGAFRNNYAKEAKVEVDKGNIDGAIELYELAIIDDPCNSALHDRFAWLYLNKKLDPKNALRYAEKALELNPHNADAAVLVALSHYHLNDIKSGDNFICMVESEGRSKAFCLLRMAIARYHYAANDTLDLKEATALLEEASAMLKQAERVCDLKTGYDAKNLKEIRKYQGLVLRKQNRIKYK